MKSYRSAPVSCRTPQCHGPTLNPYFALPGFSNNDDRLGPKPHCFLLIV